MKTLDRTYGFACSICRKKFFYSNKLLATKKAAICEKQEFREGTHAFALGEIVEFEEYIQGDRMETNAEICDLKFHVGTHKPVYVVKSTDDRERIIEKFAEEVYKKISGLKKD